MNRSAKYQVVNEKKQLETVYFETSGEQVKLLDEAGKVRGSLDDLFLKGIKLSAADVTKIKHSGIFIVGSDMKNPPAKIEVDKTAILQSTAIGAIGKPSFVHFKFVHPNGQIFNNTVVGTVQSGWTVSGKALQDELRLLNSKVDTNASEIKSHSKSISELKEQSNSSSSDFKNHNHDSRYVKLSGGTVTGDLGLQYGGSFKFVSAQGEEKNFAKYSVAQGASIGDDTVVLDVRSKGDVKHNGKKIWSEVNDGKGSGLDADLIQGVSGAYLAKRNEENTFTENQKITNGKSLIFEDNSSSEGVFWRDSKGAARSAIRSDQDGRIHFYQKDGKAKNFIDADGHITTKRGVNLDASAVEGHVVFQLSNTDKGMGVYRNNNSKYLGFYNWAKGERMAYFHQDEGYLHMDKAPSITGRRLYMQSATPKGKTVGDIWIS